MPGDSLPRQFARFAVRENDDCAEVLEVIDTSNGANVCVCTCWQEPSFAYDIARLLNMEEVGLVAS